MCVPRATGKHGGAGLELLIPSSGPQVLQCGEQQDSQRKALEGHMLFPAETRSRVPRTQAPPVSSQPTAAHRLRCPTWAWAPPTKYFKGLQTEGLILPGAPSALATSRL